MEIGRIVQESVKVLSRCAMVGLDAIPMLFLSTFSLGCLFDRLDELRGGLLARL